MCDHSKDPGGREAAMPIIAPGIWCDPCLVPLIKALNDGGLPTVASCCGHGERPGSVALADGRWLVILPDGDSFDYFDYCSEAIWPEVTNRHTSTEQKGQGNE